MTTRGTPGRSALTWAGLCAELHRLLSTPPAWLRPRTVEAARRLLTLATEDARRAAEGQTRDAQADAIGTRPRTLDRWVAAGGWLAELPTKKDDTDP